MFGFAASCEGGIRDISPSMGDPGASRGSRKFSVIAPQRAIA